MTEDPVDTFMIEAIGQILQKNTIKLVGQEYHELIDKIMMEFPSEQSKTIYHHIIVQLLSVKINQYIAHKARHNLDIELVLSDLIKNDAVSAYEKQTKNVNEFMTDWYHDLKL